MRLPEYQEGENWFIDDDKAVPMLRRAAEAGVNYFDTAFFYCHHNSQNTLGKAMKPMRDKVMLATKIPTWSVNETADFEKFLEKQLNSMDTSYIDFYHFHGLDRNAMDAKIKPLGLIKEARKAIDQGLVKHMAFSFHGDPNDMPYLIENGEGLFDSVLLHFNLFNRGNEEAIAYLAEKGVGAVIMGPVAGGRLASPSKLGQKLLGEKDTETYELALRFVLGNPNVSSACSGMTTIETLEQNLKACEREPLSPLDFENIKKLTDDLKKLSELYCPGCDYCKPCPQGINIPYIFDAFTHHNAYGMTERAKEMYRQVVNGDKDWNGNLISEPASKCTECGDCEPKCPQKIRIIEKLKETDKILSGL
jgi:hypothetical protein